MSSANDDVSIDLLTRWEQFVTAEVRRGERDVGKLVSSMLQNMLAEQTAKPRQALEQLAEMKKAMRSELARLDELEISLPRGSDVLPQPYLGKQFVLAAAEGGPDAPAEGGSVLPMQAPLPRVIDVARYRAEVLRVGQTLDKTMSVHQLRLSAANATHEARRETLERVFYANALVTIHHAMKSEPQADRGDEPSPTHHVLRGMDSALGSMGRNLGGAFGGLAEAVSEVSRSLRAIGTEVAGAFVSVWTPLARTVVLVLDKLDAGLDRAFRAVGRLFAAIGRVTVGAFAKLPRPRLPDLGIARALSRGMAAIIVGIGSACVGGMRALARLLRRRSPRVARGAAKKLVE